MSTDSRNEPEDVRAAKYREEKAEALYCTINWDSGPATWARLLEARKDDYRKAIDDGWQKVTS